jgi:hypothetical protein
VGAEQALSRLQNTRRYMIEITDVTTGKVVVIAGAD